MVLALIRSVNGTFNHEIRVAYHPKIPSKRPKHWRSLALWQSGYNLGISAKVTAVRLASEDE